MVRHLYIFNFREMAVTILKLAAFLSVVAAVAAYLGGKYKAASTENIINKFNEQRFGDFYKKEKNSCDLVFVGSSHSYCTFDPAFYDKEAGTDSFQMGMPLQLPASTYYELREIFAYQKPKTVVMEVFWGVLGTDFELNQATQLFQVMKNEELKNEYIREVFPFSEKVKYSNDVLKYQGDYFAYKSKEYDDKIRNFIKVYRSPELKQEGVEEYGTKGFIYCDYNMLEDEYDLTNQFKELDGKDYKLSDEQVKYMEKIVDLCEEEGAQLIFVTAPVAPVSLNYIRNYDIINKRIADFAERHNIPYFDYNIINSKENLVTNANFRDDAHLNYSGAQIINRHFLGLLEKEGISLK